MNFNLFLLSITVKRIADRKYMVGLIYVVNSKEFVCGAVIVAQNKVLTSAHCVYQKDSVYLKFGVLKIRDRYYNLNVTKDEIIIHKEFNGKKPYINNIAVIQLKKMINFDEKIGQIEMVDNDFKLEKGISITTLGYAYTKEEGSYLRYIDSTAANFVQCRYDYWQKDNYHLLNEEKQMCFDLDDEKQNTISRYVGSS